MSASPWSKFLDGGRCPVYSDLMTDTEQAIHQEIVRALETLGARSDLLAIVGSYKDTVPDEQVLAELRVWNTQATVGNG